MIVAVTGGAGFVGRHLVRAHLDRGDEVRVLTRRGVVPPVVGASLFRGDLAEGMIPPRFLEGAHVIYHCAGEIRDRGRMHAVHVDGTKRLVDLASGAVRRWVQLSSVGVYGPVRSGLVTESAAVAPVGVYERTKAESDRIVTDAHDRGRIEAVILRPSIIFGPAMPNRSLFQLISAVGKGVFFFIGGADASANYVPVENVVEALQLCAFRSTAAGEVFNVSDYRRLEDFIETIACSLGRKPPRRYLPEAPLRAIAAITSWLPRWPLTAARIEALTGRCKYSTEKIESMLGYKPRVSVEEALAATVEQWRAERRDRA